MIRSLILLGLVCAWVVPLEADAGTRRYALLIGLDEAPRSQLPALKHAEREVKALARILTTQGRFDPARVSVLVGSRVTRESLLKTFAELGEQMRRDAARDPDDDTLLFMVWSGHGNAGELLTRTAPLDAETLWREVGRLGSTVQVGFFDSCFSGSLTSKGVRHVTGFNPLTALPDAPLGTRGSFNVSSSTGEQLSFEHPERGSLMLQALARSFSESAPARSAVTLEQDMLPFILRRMSRLADEYGVEQTPQWKSDLVSTRPIFMSWPLARSAQVRLPDPEVGCVEVEYVDSGYVERLSRGTEADTVAIYSRPVRLGACSGVGAPLRVDEVEPGMVIPFSPADQRTCRPRPGRCWALADKSGGQRWLQDDALTVHLGAGVGHAWADDGAPWARNRVMLGARAGLGRWALSATGTLGVGDGVADALQYDVIEFDARVLLDRVLFSTRAVDLTLGAGPMVSFGEHTWAASEAGSAEVTWVHPGATALARVWLPVPLSAPWAHFALGGGVSWQQRVTGYGTGADATPAEWRLVPMIEFSAISRRISL